MLANTVYLSSIVEDPTPQLGGILDCQGYDVTSAGEIKINSNENVSWYDGINLKGYMHISTSENFAMYAGGSAAFEFGGYVEIETDGGVSINSVGFFDIHPVQDATRFLRVTHDSGSPEITTVGTVDLTLSNSLGDTVTISNLDAHLGSASNPHSVTATQVNRSTAQWNADKIQGVIVNDTAIADNFVLVYNSSSNNLEYQVKPSGETNDGVNIGAGGVPVYHGKSGANIQLRSINAGSSKVSVSYDVVNFEIDVDVVPAQINHNSLLNNHDLTTDIDHNAITNAHNLTGDIDHGSIAGLSGDDHAGYVRITGRSGGQVIIGGIDASDNITFQTTSDVTKGSYVFSELTDNGFVITSGGTGTFSIDTNSYSLSSHNHKLDDLNTPDDNTDLDATILLHGLLPKLGGGSTNFLRADGAWAAPTGGGGSAGSLDKFKALENEPPDAGYATLDTRYSRPVLDFDDSSNESAIFSSILDRSYSGGGITVYMHYSMTSAVAGDIDWDVSFERIGDQQQDIDSDGFAAAKSVDNTTVPGTSGLVDIVSIVFTDGAEIDSIAVGEGFRIKVTRDAANDTATGDAELLFVELVETP